MLKAIIHLFLIKLFYGQESHQYYFLYKKYYVKSLFRPSIKDSFVTHLEIIFNNSHMKNIISEKDIMFNNFQHPILEKDVLIKNGKPYYLSIEKKKDNILRILGYKEIIIGCEVRILYYFFKNEFFLGEIIFHEINASKVSIICKTLLSKYISNIQDNSDSFYITDNHLNQIYVDHNGFDLVIKYNFLNNTSINETITNLYKSFKQINNANKKEVINNFL